MRAVHKALGTGLLAVAAAVGVTVPATAATSSAAAGTSAAAPAAVSPGSGFVYGTDSWPMTVTGSSVYQEPVIGGNYGGYVGMVGNWARVQGCSTGNFIDFSYSNRDQANTNFTKYHIGIGTAAYQALIQLTVSS